MKKSRCSCSTGFWSPLTVYPAWMYRLGPEGFLGLHRAGAGLVIEPHIRAGWPGYDVTYRFDSTTYRICVRNRIVMDGDAALAMTVDGKPMRGNLLALHDDGEVYQVAIALRGSSSL